MPPSQAEWELDRQDRSSWTWTWLKQKANQPPPNASTHASSRLPCRRPAWPRPPPGTGTRASQFVSVLNRYETSVWPLAEATFRKPHDPGAMTSGGPRDPGAQPSPPSQQATTQGFQEQLSRTEFEAGHPHDASPRPNTNGSIHTRSTPGTMVHGR
jgi:hypothetical protein